MQQEDLEKIKEQIKSGNTAKAIKILSSNIEDQRSSLKKKVIKIEGDFNRLKREKSLGILKSDDADYKLNKLNWVLINLVEEIELNDKKVQESKKNGETKKIKTSSKYDFEELGLRTAIENLLKLQYPWGEWSDQRSVLEGEIAERKNRVIAKRGPEGPKPNVARTLFALETLSRYDHLEGIKKIENTALNWMKKSTNLGWFKEWLSTGSEFSFSQIPILKLRDDVRHTAQVATTLCKWNGERAHLSMLIKNINSAFVQANGFWPENAGETNPKLLSSIYSIEALGNIINGNYRLECKDLLSEDICDVVRNTYKFALLSISDELRKGGGLLGFSFRKPTPYLSGLSLYRIADLAHKDEDIDRISLRMIRTLDECIEKNGWSDISIKLENREQTRVRTTLRVAAGFAKYKNINNVITSSTKETIFNVLTNILANQKDCRLDSPDYACLIFALEKLYGIIIEDDLMEQILKQTKINRQIYKSLWLENYKQHYSELEHGLDEGIEGYNILAEEFLNRIEEIKNM